MRKPLEGIRILDWTIFQQGPVATTLLADLGAEVIHIEERLVGDPGRATGSGSSVVPRQPLKGGRSYYFEFTNRGKKSLTVDIRKEKGRELIYRLVEKSDVFVQNFRLGVAARHGLDYATLSRHNPQLIYVSAGGYGTEGQDAALPALDLAAQARSGIMVSNGSPDYPLPVPVGLADQTGAIMLSYAILLGLLTRERLGIGQEVDISHLGSMVLLQGLHLSYNLLQGGEFPKFSRETSVSPLFNYFRCADGKWLCLCMSPPEKYWPAFCRAMGTGELNSDSRFATPQARRANSRHLIGIFDQLFATKTREEWMALLKKEESLIYSPVQSLLEVAQDPQVLLNQYLVEFDHPELGRVKMLGHPVRLSQTPASIERPAPRLGEHNQELLCSLAGYSPEEVAQLRAEEVI